MASAKLGTKAVGSIVKLNVNGAAKEFIVVHQGKPSSLYDESCDGTWLLMKDIFARTRWHSSDVNNLENSTIHSILNSTLLNAFESKIRDAIKQVKIPYRKNGGSSGSDQSGANGLLCKISCCPATRLASRPAITPTSRKMVRSCPTLNLEPTRPPTTSVLRN